VLLLEFCEGHALELLRPILEPIEASHCPASGENFRNVGRPNVLAFSCERT
jgi:hypothetical protein